jgi:hypothetical protein
MQGSRLLTVRVLRVQARQPRVSSSSTANVSVAAAEATVPSVLSRLSASAAMESNETRELALTALNGPLLPPEDEPPGPSLSGQDHESLYRQALTLQVCPSTLASVASLTAYTCRAAATTYGAA